MYAKRNIFVNLLIYIRQYIVMLINVYTDVILSRFSSA